MLGYSLQGSVGSRELEREWVEFERGAGDRGDGEAGSGGGGTAEEQKRFQQNQSLR